MTGTGRKLPAVGLIVAALLAAMFGHPVALAQSDANPATYTSEFTGWQIEVAGPNFALQHVALEEYPHGQGERIYINSVESLSFAEVAFYDDADAPDDTIAVMMREFQATSQSFTVIESGNSAGVYHSLAKFQLNATISGYFYIEVAQDIAGNVDFVQSLYTMNLDFGTWQSLASEEITVDGSAFLGETMINVDAVIAADAQANPLATPMRTMYEFESANSIIEVHPPVSLDFDSNANGFESVNVSMASTFGIIGYLQQEAAAPPDVLADIIADAPIGDEAPILIYSEENTERVFAVYRIDREGRVVVMVIQVTAFGPGLWRVEAIAGSEAEIVADFGVFQQSVIIDGQHFLEDISGGMLTDILSDTQP